MKQKIFFGIILLLLLAGCGTQPTYTDNGNPGQIKAVVFYDDNQNGVMDNGETGAPQRVALSQEVTCTPANLEFVPTDANMVKFFSKTLSQVSIVFLSTMDMV